MRKVLVLCSVFAALVSSANAAKQFHVGLTNRTFLKGDASYDWRGAQTHALLTTIWYPADASAKEKEQ